MRRRREFLALCPPNTIYDRVGYRIRSVIKVGSRVDIFIWKAFGQKFGLDDHSPVKKKPKDRFSVVLEFMPPCLAMTTDTLRVENQSLQRWEFLSSCWVLRRVFIRTIQYGRIYCNAFRERHCLER